MRHCPSCGNATVAADATLCGHCGRALVDPLPALTPRVESEVPALGGVALPVTAAADSGGATSEPPGNAAVEPTMPGYGPRADEAPPVVAASEDAGQGEDAGEVEGAGEVEDAGEAEDAGEVEDAPVESQPTDALPAMPRLDARTWSATIGYALRVGVTWVRLGLALRRLQDEVRRADRQLDGAYAEFGQALRAAGGAPRGGAAALGALERLDAQRTGLEQHFARLRAEQQVAEQRFADAERIVGDRRDRAEARARELEQTLGLRRGEDQALRARLVAQRGVLRQLARERDGLRVRAARGGPSEESQSLERAAAEKAVALGDATRAHAETEAARQRLADVLRELSRALAQERGQVRSARREQRVARRELTSAKRAIEQREDRCTADLLRLDEEAGQQLGALGRMALAGEESQDERFAAPLARVARQRATWGRLQQQRALAQQRQRDYDLPTLRRGLAGAGTLALVVLAVLLAVLALRA